MRAVVQRVSRAAVRVDGAEVAVIGRGLAVLAGVAEGDGEAEAAVLAAKLAGLRIFADGGGKMNLSVTEAKGEVLLVSQFTLLADTRKGRRPSFVAAADPGVAEPLVERVAQLLREAGVVCRTGRFGAMMEVDLINEGPVTIVLDVVDGRVR